MSQYRFPNRTHAALICIAGTDNVEAMVMYGYDRPLQSYFIQVDISPLTNGQSKAIIEQLLNQDYIPKVARAEGRPPSSGVVKHQFDIEKRAAENALTIHLWPGHCLSNSAVMAAYEYWNVPESAIQAVRNDSPF